MPIYNALADASYAGTYTLATMPAATGLAGRWIRVSNVGLAPGVRMVSDGTRWIADGAQVLARANVDVVTASNSTEQTLATVAIPAGFLGLSGSLRILTNWEFAAASGTTTYRARLGGTALLGYAIAPGTTSDRLSMLTTIANRNAANAQMVSTVGMGANAGSTTGAGVAVDTSVAQNLTITSQSVTSEIQRLKSYLVELLP